MEGDRRVGGSLRGLGGRASFRDRILQRPMLTLSALRQSLGLPPKQSGRIPKRSREYGYYQGGNRPKGRGNVIQTVHRLDYNKRREIVNFGVGLARVWIFFCYLDFLWKPSYLKPDKIQKYSDEQSAR